MTSKIKHQRSKIGQEPLRVLVLNWRDPRHPLAGGAEISLLEHAKYWQDKGAEITWFASSFKNAKEEEVIDGTKVVRRGSHYTVHLHFFKSYILSHKSYNHDVIVDCFHFIPFFTPLFIRSRKIVAFIHEVAGGVWYRNLPYILAFIGEKVEPLFFKAYRNIPFITVSNSTKKELELLGIKKNNIHVIPNGINAVEIDKKIRKEKTPTIIFLGRVSKDKGIEDALQAFNMISGNQKPATKNQQPITDIQLWIVGKEERPGMLQEILDDGSWVFEETKNGFKATKSKEQDTRNSIESQIQYYGYIDEKKKFELLKRAWILIHPSTKEGWGLNVIEAASQGTPTVGYNIEGLRDSIKDGETGVLVNTTPESLSEEIVRLLENKKEYSTLSKNALKWSRTFSWEKSGEKSWKVISKA